ncbi:MAG: cyclic nucleotide-binding domain-containing protein [Nitrospinae bacterium]|nr:cyclic nucleotide-binding domain-containing protein [Nitrospinota bacterium]
MLSENNRKFLKRIPFLKQFNDDELLTFFKSLEKPISVDGQTVVMKEGAADNTSYIILEGECGVFKTTNGKRTLIDKIGKTQVVGEMSEFLGGHRTASVIVTSFDAKLLKVDIGKLPHELRVKIREEQCQILANRLIKKNDEFSSLTNEIFEIKDKHGLELNQTVHKYKSDIEKLKAQVTSLENEIKKMRVDANR